MIDRMDDDDDITLPDDSQFDAWIEKVAPSLNAPPATPRLEMWDAIASAQAKEVPGVLRFRRARWVVPTAIAAALILGIGVHLFMAKPDRVATIKAVTPSAVAALIPSEVEGPAPRTLPNSVERSANNAQRVATARPSGVAPRDSIAATDPSQLYRLAAVQTLSQAEALLTAYRASDVAKTNAPAAHQLGLWGREVLSSTRLLLDSPAGDDPQLRSLLNDLELVLVQIIRLSGAPLDASDRALIDKALRDRDLLPRIRTAVPAGVAGSASDD